MITLSGFQYTNIFPGTIKIDLTTVDLCQILSWMANLPTFICVNGRSGVNFINILHAHFSYVSKLSSFSLVMFGFVIFGAKMLYKKWVRKTLMKLRQTKFCVFCQWWRTWHSASLLLTFRGKYRAPLYSDLKLDFIQNMLITSEANWRAN